MFLFLFQFSCQISNPKYNSRQVPKKITMNEIRLNQLFKSSSPDLPNLGLAEQNRSDDLKSKTNLRLIHDPDGCNVGSSTDSLFKKILTFPNYVSDGMK